MSGHRGHQLGKPAWLLFGDAVLRNEVKVYFVTCPHTIFTKTVPALAPELHEWAAQSFIYPLYFNGYIWILSPNPGCEW